MIDTSDPFRHHPRLRDLVIPAEESTFRHIDTNAILQFVTEHGGDPSFITPDEDRDTERAAFLKDRWDTDMWVFAYGSLIWDPAIVFSELRRAHAPGYARRFILVDTSGGRGSVASPGVMAALDYGHGCDGLALRVPRELLEEETRRLWQRERIGHAYLPAFITVQTEMGDVEALTFIADYKAYLIQPDLPYDRQVALCATGEGFLGTSRAYVENIITHFEEMRIHDADLKQFWTDVCAHPAKP
ncbi:gamma-glutamylcyclotransferase [Actibacterium pelagium]|uniref:glutathione-specific gamma-glutamylcyclotransferase n=1 Tax=Actibacterium pelagium TaxID=2029103 RepID=A0A917ELY9_9RHOB|nr:gamma-glutamylcyclotransferase [Actibacterium pelagium]GGE58951.1 gamma-glutamylcyclotransferase [Actibacterium pelagium]